MYMYFSFRYRTLGHTASQSRISTFFLLLDLMQFFDLYHAGQLHTALDVSLTRTLVLNNYIEICVCLLYFYTCTIEVLTHHIGQTVTVHVDFMISF